MAVLSEDQMEAILDLDSQEPFQTFLSDLMFKKWEAMLMLEMMKDKDPDSFAIKLLHYLTCRHDISTHQECAQQLRNLLVSDDGLYTTCYYRLSVSTQSAIKRILLHSMKLEKEDLIVMEEFRYTVYKLAISHYNNWPELLPFLIQCLTDSTSTNFLKQSVFWLLDGLPMHLGDTIVPFVEPLCPLFRTTLNDHTLDLDLRIEATTAVISFIRYVPVSSNDKQRFQELLPGMMTTLTDSLTNCDKANNVLDLFIHLAKKDPKFFRWHLRDVVYSMLEIAEDEKLEMTSRHLAVEFVLTLVEAREKAPGMMRKLPLFTHTCFAILLNMLLDIKDEPSWHSADNDLDMAGETDNYNFGRVCLNRFSIALGGKTIAPVAMEQLRDYLVAPEWEKRHAALVALYQITKGSSKVMVKYLQKVVDMVLRSFQVPHPRVKWAAIRAINRMSVDFRPVFQEQYHSRVLPALAKAMEDFENPRVQARAARALEYFEKPETVVPYLDKILNKLLVLLRNDNQMIQGAALKALGHIVLLSKEHFLKYYDIVVPSLKTILVNTSDKSNHSLLRYALALECISMVAMAVGKEKFRDDFKQVMELLKLLQESQMKELDSVVYLLKVCFKLCISMEKDFLPYMSTVMPHLVECAQLEPDKTVSSYEVYGSIHKVKIGDTIIYVRGSDLLTAKSKACAMLVGFALVLKEDFYPWISQAASILVPLLKFHIHDRVRENIMEMYYLLRSAKLAVEKGITQGGNMYFKQLSGDMIMALGKALYSEPKTKICALILEELNNCLKIIGPLLDEDQIGSIVDAINHVMEESSYRKGELAERGKSEDFDAEDAELMREEREQEIEIFGNVGYILSTLIKTFKAGFLSFLDKLSLYLIPMRGEDKAAEERKTCILIFDDIVEHCGESAIKYYKIYLPFLLESSNDESPDVRQVALYGLGFCAEYGGYSFKPFIGEALSRIDVVLPHFNALEPENVKAYDNAVYLLGKICRFHGESINSALILPAWLNCLPIKRDLIEAKVVHEQLCLMVERSDREIFGPRYEHFPKILSVFTEVLCAGKDLATEETTNRMKNVLRNLTKTLPPIIWASAWSLLLPQQAMELE